MKFSGSGFYIFGRITQDPEVKTSRNDKSYMRLSVVWDESFKKGDGTWDKRPHFLDVGVFGYDAENVYKQLRKGDQILIFGVVKTSKYEKDGKWITKVELAADNFIPVPKAKLNTNGQMSDVVGRVMDEFGAEDMGGYPISGAPDGEDFPF